MKNDARANRERHGQGVVLTDNPTSTTTLSLGSVESVEREAQQQSASLVQFPIVIVPEPIAIASRRTFTTSC
ncbi:hypothetical protein VTN49DRAFT_6669 [Thermomyces lanuginosus]|uniref:uncharacterized protein n=1 Tax=Thermomyces lanuginosus TaxID=5541 RepID=UPI00374316C2